MALLTTKPKKRYPCWEAVEAVAIVVIVGTVESVAVVPVANVLIAAAGFDWQSYPAR